MLKKRGEKVKVKCIEIQKIKEDDEKGLRKN